jgi:hydrogenase maturation protein HypF
LQDDELDFRPLLLAVIRDRVAGRDPSAIAYAFHAGIAEGITGAVKKVSGSVIALSGGVFQNGLLQELLRDRLHRHEVWINRAVPPNDGGISLGQAALAAFHSNSHA